MKRILLFILLLSTTGFLGAQTGPGGIGNSSNLLLWLNADSIAGTNGSPVDVWYDLSSQNNDATQSSVSNQPTLYVDSVNGHNVVNFDGNDFIPLSNSISSNPISIYLVLSNSGTPTNNTVAISTQDHSFASYISATGGTGLRYSNNYYEVPGAVTDKLEMVTGQTDGVNSSIYMSIRGDTNVYSGVPSSLNNQFASFIGAELVNFAPGNFHEGNIAEIIVFNSALNPVQRRILMNAITAKYGSDMLISATDHYDYQNNFSHNVIGIGELNGTSQTDSRGRGELRVLDPDDLDEGEFLLTGHDNAVLDTTSADVPATFKARLTRVWRADKTGDPGLVDLEFYIDANYLPLSRTFVLIDDDGDFSNASVHNFGRTVFVNDGYVTFADVNLPDGSYYTLGVIDDDNVIRSVQSGDWNVNSTWDCNCVPNEPVNIVQIVDNHVVDLNTEKSTGSLTVEENAVFNLNSGAIFHVFDSLVINGTINNSGLIEIEGTNNAVFINNRSDALTNPIDLYSLDIDNPSGLTLNNSLWELENTLQIHSGSLINNGTFIFNSDENLTAQILPSVPNSFSGSGEYIMERFISSRRAEFANLAAPATTTIGDWDQEIYMSGVGGNDGNAQYTPAGPIYYSVISYDNISGTYDSVTSINTTITPGQGYELFLGDNLIEYTPSELDTINVRGIPTSGDVNVTVGASGWMLLGNPYQAFIRWSQVSKPSNTTNYYYVMNASTGNYSLYDGTNSLIPPSQSFWVERTASGNGTVTFTESDKVYNNSANTSTFLRTKYSNSDSLIISVTNSENPYRHKHIVEINPLSSTGEDENDISYLPSRLKGVPAIYSSITSEKLGRKRDLMVSSIGTSVEKQAIPLHFTAGMDAEYTLSFDNKNSIYNCAVLEDKMSRKLIDINEQEDYTFYSEEGNFDRFILHLSKSTFDCQKEQLASAAHHLFELERSNNNYYLNYDIGENTDRAVIHIFDGLGRQVKTPQSHSIKNSGNILLETPELSGVYFIQVQTEKGRKFSEKIHIH